MTQISTPLLSVSLITYNHQDFIAKAIDSILSQKVNFPIEIIIGDDFSTDATREILVSYKQKYPEIIKLLLHPGKNSGLPGKLNFLSTIDAATGKYIALLDGDDYWTDENKLQKQVDFLEANESYSACFHYTQLMQNNELKNDLYGEHNGKLDFVAEDTFSTSALLHSSAIVFRRDAFKTPEWFYEIISGDMALFSIVALKGELKCIPEIMSVYRKHDNGFTNTERVLSKYHSDRIVLMKHLNEHSEFKYQKKIDEVISYHNSELGAVKVNESDFIDVPFTIENLDIYIVRTNIFNALKKNITSFKGQLLDVGCGKMPYKKYVLKNSSVSSYIGLDIETALEYAPGTRPDFTWNGIEMPFKDNRFETAFATEVLEHCPKPEIVLKETCRVLKPGGCFFFTVPFLWPLHEVPHDEFRYTPFSLKRLLEESGFTDIKITATGGWHSTMAQMLGLWVCRAPIKTNRRKILTRLLKPVIGYLLKKDNYKGDTFTESQMITGLYGIAFKK